MITRCNQIHFAKQRARRRSCPTLCSMAGVLAAVPFISQQTTGDFTNRIFANAAVGVPWLGQNWPITYADLEPYYTKAEWELGVSGQAGANPFDPPRSKPYPLPPMPVKSAG